MYVQALNEALVEEMGRDASVFLIGEDIGYSGGGVFRVTTGLADRFGDGRVRETPISESAIIGTAVGAAATGLRPVAEIMYMDFITCGMDQVANQAAKISFMSGGQVRLPLVIRTPSGMGTREAAQHSQSLEAWFVHTPGLKVVMPATVYDAKGLLKSSIRDDGPVLFIENRMLYYEKESVPEGEWVVPLGQAAIRREGDQLTVVATAYALHKALKAAEMVAGEVSVEVIDPRTLVPLDMEAITRSLEKTGRLLVVHEAPVRGGFGAEVVRRAMESAFEYLDCAPRVLGGAATPMPYSPPLEDACVPQVEDIVAAMRAMVGR
ncbi:MAG: alpha-ketoacid dehydrogenase subunit beta [Anaerolineae bacterium]|nr:alpha-ketoacid dehydrogenase subunit beta [Anaerolineae bacterium]